MEVFIHGFGRGVLVVSPHRDGRAMRVCAGDEKGVSAFQALVAGEDVRGQVGSA